MNGGPVFIGGLAFSGKTPLRIALSAHPRLVLTRHTAMWSRFAGRFGDLGRDDNLRRCLEAMVADRAIGRLRPDPQRIEREFRQGRPTYARLFALVHEHHAQRLGKARWGDQMGLLEHYADAILSAYPGARMIHMIRDPRARHAASAAREPQRPGGLGRETARWRYSAGLATRNAGRYPGRYRVLRFEDLAAAPEATLRDLAAFLGEEYSPAMTAAIAGAGLASAVAPGTHALAPAPHVSSFIERHAAPQLTALGYPARTTGIPPRARPRFPVLSRPADRVGLAMWRPAHPAPAPQGRA